MTAASGQAALDQADDYSSYDTGMCLKWVRTCWGIGSLYGSAIEAWNGAKFKHPGDRHPPVGAPMFYAGGKYGHIVISRGTDSRMRSTDCTTSGRVGNEDLVWPVDAWGDTYLGWTEDLNGVRLPLASDTTPGDDDMPQYDHASTGTNQKIAKDDWVAITWQSVASGKAFEAGRNTARLEGRSYSANVHVVLDAPEGSTIRLRAVEVAGGQTVESNPQVEALATGGSSYVELNQIGHVGDDRAWAVRVSCSQAATLTSADVTVLSW